jgi:acyl-CoA synthetase (AMP-forming)/AMP-acid ligase II
VRNIRAVASGLAKLGLRKGDVFAIYSSNSPEWVFLFFAILCNGATVTTINPSYTACKTALYAVCIFRSYFIALQTKLNITSRTQNQSLYTAQMLTLI